MDTGLVKSGIISYLVGFFCLFVGGFFGVDNSDVESDQICSDVYFPFQHTGNAEHSILLAPLFCHNVFHSSVSAQFVSQGCVNKQ